MEDFYSTKFNSNSHQILLKLNQCVDLINNNLYLIHYTKWPQVFYNQVRFFFPFSDSERYFFKHSVAKAIESWENIAWNCRIWKYSLSDFRKFLGPLSTNFWDFGFYNTKVFLLRWWWLLKPTLSMLYLHTYIVCMVFYIMCGLSADY